MIKKEHTSNNPQTGNSSLGGVGSSYFDLSLTYTKGDSVIFNELKYIFKPNEKQEQFITGIIPTDGKGWHIL